MLAFVACAPDHSPEQSVCVPVMDGQTYEIQSGRLVLANTTRELEPGSDASTTNRGLSEWLSTAGYTWLDVQEDGRFVYLLGLADAPDSKSEVLGATRSYLRNDDARASAILVDGISVASNGFTPPGAIPFYVSGQPSAEECSGAYERFGQASEFSFQPGMAVLAPDASPHLNALAALTDKCNAYPVTVSVLETDNGEALAAGRADTIRRWLLDLGAASQQVSAGTHREEDSPASVLLELGGF